jgi:methylated-DNA-protein-cysteine methyltransferase-like protein
MPTPEAAPGPRKLPPEFADQVIAVVRRIPKGRLASYGQVAVLAGFPGRPRQVGMVLKGLPSGTRVPWHRVVNNQGHIPSQGRAWSALEQARRLMAEGIVVDAAGDLDLEAHRWRPKVTS